MRIQWKQRKPNNKGRKELAKQTAKPSGPSYKNNGLQTQEIKKRGIEEASGLKEARKERNSIPWAVYDIEK